MTKLQQSHGISAAVVLDSVSPLGYRLVTFQLRFHRYILSEFNKHRALSSNASSSRAIPVRTMLKQVWNDPAMPVAWGQNKPGMQAATDLKGFRLGLAKGAWVLGAKVACGLAWAMGKIGLHKQVANRILETWQFTHVVVSGTEWENFFNLRDHSMAQPEIQVLARAMKSAMQNSTPKLLQEDEWHLPYVTALDFDNFGLEICKKLSTARCARVSYLTHDKKVPDVKKDVKLHEDLVGSSPIHATPTEHQATPSGDVFSHKNLVGWIPYRQEVEDKIYREANGVFD